MLVPDRSMIESESITEEATTWRTGVVASIERELGLEKVMIEAVDRELVGCAAACGARSASGAASSLAGGGSDGDRCACEARL